MSSGRLLGSEAMMRAVPLTVWKMVSMLYLAISRVLNTIFKLVYNTQRSIQFNIVIFQTINVSSLSLFMVNLGVREGLGSLAFVFQNFAGKLLYHRD